MSCALVFKRYKRFSEDRGKDENDECHGRSEIARTDEKVRRNIVIERKDQSLSTEIIAKIPLTKRQ